MKILMVISNFIPEIGSAAHVYYDLARAFISKGHDVSVITSYPRKFNLSKDDSEKSFPVDEVINGIVVHRVKNNVDRDHLISRGLEHFTLSRKFFKVFKRTGMDYDICLIYIPPLPLYTFAVKIKKKAGIPSVLNFQDFHPQELTDVELLKNPLIIWLMKRIEKKAYANADHIVVLTNGGIDYVVSRGADPNKVTHIFNSKSIRKSAPVVNDFKNTQSIQNKVLITYAGILSPFQGIDTILNAAKIVKNDDRIIIYIVGDGMIKPLLEERIKNEEISNVVMLPLQPRNIYENIINSSDASIISLDIRMKAPCFPGKTINIMAAKKPIIALVSDCETKNIINDAKCGIIVDPIDAAAVARAFTTVADSPGSIALLGESGAQFLETNCNIDSNVDRFISIFDNLKKGSLK